jgi:hypothetical protein
MGGIALPGQEGAAVGVRAGVGENGQNLLYLLLCDGLLLPIDAQ